MSQDILKQVIKTVLSAGALTVAAAFLLAFFFLVLKRNHRFSLIRWGVPCLFIVYLLTVLSLTLFERNSTMGQVDLHLFSSYFNAWNRFTAAAWQMPIYNLLMFVPLGFLLPLLHPLFLRAKYTLAAGAGLTLIIEFTQLFTHTGVFEADDLLNNFLGCWIGWGLITAALKLLLAIKNHRWEWPLLFSVLKALFPFLMISFLFAAVFIRYQLQPYGNFENGPVYLRSMNKVEILAEKLNEEVRSAWVYQRIFYDQSMLLERFEDLKSLFGFDMEVNAANKEELSFFNDQKERLILEESGDFFLVLRGTELSYKEAAERLALYFGLSKEEYTLDKEGRMSVLFNSENNRTASGEAEITLNEDQLIIDCRIREAEVKQMERLISEKEAWHKIEAGWFRLYGYDNIQTIALLDSSIVYQRDTKQFYQPVYQFRVLIDGKDSLEILIPAIAQ